ncbi:MAG: B-box zinc finger protein [Actinomycetales bacterium]
MTEVPNPAQVPTCPVHPDRSTYIRCTRCDRPVCTECMVSAPVGFQCRECVGLAAAQRPQPQTPVGAAIPTRPTVTYVLIGLTVAAFLLQLTLVRLADPDRCPNGIDDDGVAHGCPYSLSRAFRSSGPC